MTRHTTGIGPDLGTHLDPGSDRGVATGGATRSRRILTIGLVAVLMGSGFGYSGIHGATASDSSLSDAAATTVGTAPEGRRVDLAKPTFSNPTSITHSLFPISELSQVIQLGAEAGEPLRHEITPLPQTRFIKWKGQRVETVVSQFVAYGDGRVLEVAVDYFAQADDGSVWYFGEDVDNYEDGVIANHDGSWLAGKDGPPGMIMPAHPRVGDVYRPENIPGLVFEEVTVKAIDQTVDGPRGPVHGAILVEERLMDGTVEGKIFAPGYGEFEARVPSSDELVTVALAVPTDARPGSVPRALSKLSTSAVKVFDAVPSERWDRISDVVDSMSMAWEIYQQRDVPGMLDTQMSDALEALEAAVDARDPADARQAAIAAGHASLDLQLQYREPADIDEARLGVWRRQLAVDRGARDPAAVAGDLATLDTIRDRFHDD